FYFLLGFSIFLLVHLCLFFFFCLVPHMHGCHPSFISFFFLLRPTSTLFPYTTLFRSWHACGIFPPLCHASDRDRAPTRKRDTMEDRKSTRLNSSHVSISYAVFCLQKKILNSRKFMLVK